MGVANLRLPAFAGMAAIPAAAFAATPERQKEALDVVAAVVEGKQAPEAAGPYFAKRAVYVGPTRDPWDIVKFKASLEAAGCGTRSNFWPQDRVLNGVNREFADGLRKTGHPKGPGLTFYCASPTVIAGHSMITFKFEGDKIAEVEQAYYVPVPPPPPAPPGLLEGFKRQRAAVALVRKHFILLARSDPAELPVFLGEIAAIPVAGVPGITNLKDYYLNAFAEDGRTTRANCFASQDFDTSGEVRCYLSIEREGAGGAALRSDYTLAYVLKNDRVVRMRVAETAPPTMSN